MIETFVINNLSEQNLWRITKKKSETLRNIFQGAFFPKMVIGLKSCEINKTEINM